MSKFDELAKKIKKDLQSDNDRIILFSGKERSGKSSAAYEMAKLIDPTFTHKRMNFNAAELSAMAVTLPAGSVVVLDEAIDGGFSRDAMNKHNKEFVKFLIVCGERNLCVMICFPNIKWLDSYLSEHRLHYWCLVSGKGRGRFHHIRAADYKGTKASWQPMFTYSGLNNPAGETEWELYRKMKREKVQRLGESSQNKWVPEPQDVQALAEKILLIVNQ